MNDHDLDDLFAIKPPRRDGETRFDFSLFYERIGAPPALPLDILPRLWGPWCDGAARGASTPADYVALALLGSAASLLGGRCRVTPAPGWSEPCILWTALVGPPSSGKTPAIEAVLRLVREAEQRPDSDGAPAPAAGEPVPTAPPHSIVIGDTSVEAIAAVLQGAPRGVLLARDEHGDWLGHMVRGTCDGRAHAFWLSAWAGRPCSVSRRGPSIALADPAVSILGTLQPEALEQALARDHEGMLARFLFVRPMRAWPRPLPATDMAASPEAIAALRRLHDMPATQRDLSLSAEALAAFEGFRRAHDDALTDLAGRAADWWGKGPGTVLRLAGVLTFLDWAAQPAGTAEPAQVAAWALGSAARLWRDVLWPHAQATLRIAGAGGERERHVRKVVRWLKLHGPHVVSRETLRRDALGQALDAAATDRVIDALVEGGWLEPCALTPGARGRRPLRWHVLPGLWKRSDEASVATGPHPAPVDTPNGASSRVSAQSGPLCGTTDVPPKGADFRWPTAPHPEEAAPDRSAGAAVSKGGEQSRSCVQGLSGQRCGSAPFETLAALAPQGEEVGERPKLAPMGTPPAVARGDAGGEVRAPEVPAAAALNVASDSRPPASSAAQAPKESVPGWLTPYADGPMPPHRGGQDVDAAEPATIPAVSATRESVGASPKTPGPVAAAAAQGEAEGASAAPAPILYDDDPMPPRHPWQRACGTGRAIIPAVSARATGTAGAPPEVAHSRVNGAGVAHPPVRP